MNSHVQQKPIGKRKLLATDETGEIFLSGMNAEVGAQTAGQRKLPIASRANVRSPRLSSATSVYCRPGHSMFIDTILAVRLHVGLEIVSPCKTAATLRTLKVLFAAVHDGVRAQTLCTAEDFTTVGTRINLATVQAHVFRQQIGTSKMLATCFALIGLFTTMDTFMNA